MSEILWVNPVGTGAFDAETLELIGAVASDAHVARVRHLQSGPPHLEYHLYEHEALSGMLQLMRQAEDDGCGAGIIGCCTLGHRFSVVVGRRKWIPEVQADPETFLDRVLEQGRRAVEEDGAEAIVLSECEAPA
jgi:Asp/Glu/hydantoin racemase